MIEVITMRGEVYTKSQIVKLYVIKKMYKQKQKEK